LIELKVNIKSLAAEAVINRQQARLLSGVDRWGLNHHRKTVLRREARAALLAYAYLRGKPRGYMEGAGASTPDMKHLKKKVERFANGNYDEANFDGWMKGLASLNSRPSG